MDIQGKKFPMKNHFLQKKIKIKIKNCFKHHQSLNRKLVACELGCRNILYFTFYTQNQHKMFFQIKKKGNFPFFFSFPFSLNRKAREKNEQNCKKFSFKSHH